MKLEQTAMESFLKPEIKAQIETLEIHQKIDSTNQYLLSKSAPQNQQFQVCLAEQQSNGRGRRGREWFSPDAANLYLSIAKTSHLTLSEAAGLSILTALSTVQTIRKFGVDAGLKWPNDIYCQNKKLAGILLEVHGLSSNQIKVVIGIGINVNMPLKPQIDQPWIDMQQTTNQTKAIDRNQLAATLLNQLIDDIADYEKNQLTHFYPQWQQYDIWFDQTVCLQFADHEIIGINKGINNKGYLRLLINNEIQYFYAGEVSLRNTQP